MNKEKIILEREEKDGSLSVVQTDKKSRYAYLKKGFKLSKE